MPNHDPYGPLTPDHRAVLKRGYSSFPLAFPPHLAADLVDDLSCRVVEEHGEWLGTRLVPDDQARFQAAVRSMYGTIREAWDAFAGVLRERGLAELLAVQGTLDKTLVRLDSDAPTLDPDPGEPTPIPEEHIGEVRGIVAFRLSVARNVVQRFTAFGDASTWDEMQPDERPGLHGVPGGHDYGGRAADFLRAWGEVRGRHRDSNQGVILEAIGRRAPMRADRRTGPSGVREALLEAFEGTDHDIETGRDYDALRAALDAAWREQALADLARAAEEDT